MADARPIIIIKKKAGHAGHHGGAWKVAYADFVTAMMALFIVLWLLNTNKPVREAIAGYFKDPSGTSEKLGSNLSGTGESVAISKDNMPKLKEELQKSIKQMANFDKFKDQLNMTVTGEGLRIELLETESGTFFESGKPQPSASGSELLIHLAEELGKLPNNISIEGHTDSKPYAESGSYGNWELSTDRANAARHLMQEHGVRPDQVTQVRGFADQRLRNSAHPLDASNRRISVIVQYIIPNDAEAADAKPSSENASDKQTTSTSHE